MNQPMPNKNETKKPSKCQKTMSKNHIWELIQTPNIVNPHIKDRHYLYCCIACGLIDDLYVERWERKTYADIIVKKL